MNRRLNFWTNWLLVATAGVELFAIAMLWPGWPAQLFFEWLLLPGVAPFAPEAASYVAILYGVLGSVMIGWMISLFAIIIIPFRRGESWAWLGVAGSFAIWYIIDSALSFALGYPLNALSNTGFALLFLIPLAATYRTFFPAAQQSQTRTVGDRG